MQSSALHLPPSRVLPAQHAKQIHRHPRQLPIVRHRACTLACSALPDVPASHATMRWAPSFAAATTLFTAAAAWADEAEDVIIEQVDALEAQSLSGVLAASAQEQSLYDTLVSVVFVGVVGALSVVTLGVGYLSLVQWLDNRQEKQDQEAQKNPTKAAQSGDKASQKKEDEVEVVSLKKSFQIKRDKTKGFGGNVTTTPKEF